MLVLTATFPRFAAPLAPPPPPLWETAMVNCTGGAACATFGTPLVLPRSQTLATYAVNTQTNSTLLVLLALGSGRVLWTAPTPFVVSSSGWVVADDDETALFHGTPRGVVKRSRLSGAVLWRHEALPTQQVPAHPTYIAGTLLFTFENGPLSTPIFALDAADGRLLATTPDLAFSLIWPLPNRQPAVVYMSFTPPSTVSIVCRSVAQLVSHQPQQRQQQAFEPPFPVLWNVSNLPTTGLNNNPNLDVAATGANAVLAYLKPTPTLRQFALLNASTGAWLWVRNTTGPVPDYDTFADGGRFFRMLTLPQPPNTFELQALAANGSSVWTTRATCADANSILLVGGGGVFIFSPDAHSVQAFDEASGTPLWALPVPVPNDGAAASNVLYFGDGLGVFRAMPILN